MAHCSFTVVKLSVTPRLTAADNSTQSEAFGGDGGNSPDQV